MTNTQEQVKVKHNLNTYYILPLLKLNVNSFGVDNFVLSQVTNNGEVVVFIKETGSEDYYNHPNYAADVEEEIGVMIIYNIPEEFKKDFEFFLESKYSKMSPLAKDYIKAHAKANDLKWKEEITEYLTDDNGKKKKATYIESSRCLMALDLDENLKEAMEVELDVKIKQGSELQDKLDLNKELIEL